MLLRVKSCFLLLCVCFLALAMAAAAGAQVVFTGAQQTLASFPAGDSVSSLAVDGLGDAFFVVTDGTTNTLYEMPAGGSLTVLNNALGFFPSGLAVDAAGAHLYFIYFGGTPACGGLSYVYVATAVVGSGTAPANLPCSFQFSGYTLNYTDPTGLAMDGAGNLYIADFGAGEIYKLNAPVTAASVPAGFVALYQQPYDIAVTPAGAIEYTALDYSNNGANTLFSVTKTAFTSTLPANGVSAVVVAAGLPSIQSGLAIDAGGNTYVGGGSSPAVLLSGTRQAPVYGGFAYGTAGVAVNTVGDVWLTGTTGSSVPALAKVSLSGVNLGTRGLTLPTSTVALNFFVEAGTTVGSVGVLTGGLTGKDFADAGASTCAAKTYTADTSCVVNVRMTARTPGQRLGAVLLSDGSGSALATGPLYGIGSGPQVMYQGGVLAPVASGLSEPLGIKVDAAGNVLIADALHQRVVKISPAGVQSTVGSGYSEPSGLALDDAGNVYVSDLTAGKVYCVTPNGVQTTYLSGLTNPYGLALDTQGNLFVSEALSGVVLKVSRLGVQTTVGSGLTIPYELTVDGSGNLFIGDFSSGNVYKVTPGGTQTTVATGIDEPVGVTVDAAGDVYVVAYGMGEVYQISPAGVQTTVATGLTGPYGVAQDSSGNLLITDYGADTAAKAPQGLAPTLSYATTAGGSESVDSPKTVTLQNMGNAVLSFSQVSSAADFPKDAGGAATACTAATKLTAAATCTLSYDFKPVALSGTSTTLAISEQAKFATNTLNMTGTLGHVTLTGTETKLAPTVALTAAIGSGGTLVLSAKLTGSGAAPGGTVTFYSGGAQVGTPVTLSSTGKASLTTTRPMLKHTYTAVSSGDAVYASAKSNGVVINTTDATPAVTLTASPNPAAHGAVVTLTATVSTTIAGLPPTGIVQFTVSNVVVGSSALTGSQATFTSSTLTTGTRTIVATYLGDGNYLPASSAAVKEVITP